MATPHKVTRQPWRGSYGGRSGLRLIWTTPPTPTPPDEAPGRGPKPA